MSREIKFRMWCSNKGEWESNHWAIDKSGKPFCFHGDRYRGVYTKNHIIEQFTGLYDRNGKEIYGGDIVRLGYGIPPTTATMVIEWREDIETYSDMLAPHVGWYMRGINGSQSSALCTCFQIDLEVIGNIHESPELMEDIHE